MPPDATVVDCTGKILMPGPRIIRNKKASGSISVESYKSEAWGGGCCVR